MGKRPLLGTLVLDGFVLNIPFRDAEAVTVEAL
jgi:hypothetical protein